MSDYRCVVSVEYLRAAPRGHKPYSVWLTVMFASDLALIFTLHQNIFVAYSECRFPLWSATASLMGWDENVSFKIGRVDWITAVCFDLPWSLILAPMEKKRGGMCTFCLWIRRDNLADVGGMHHHLKAGRLSWDRECKGILLTVSPHSLSFYTVCSRFVSLNKYGFIFSVCVEAVGTLTLIRWSAWETLVNVWDYYFSL